MRIFKLLVSGAILVWLALVVGNSEQVGQAQADCTVTVEPRQSIQRVIDAAPEGAVICLGAGTWEENLKITKSLTLHGAGREQTVIQGGGKLVIWIKSAAEIVVALERLTVTQGTFGILAQGSPTITLANLLISRNQDTALALTNSAQAHLSAVQIADNLSDGLVVTDNAKVISIINSTVSGNRNVGLALGDSNTVLVHVQVINNGIGLVVGGRVTIKDSQIAENSDGLYVIKSAEVVMILNSRFENNRECGIRMDGDFIFGLDNRFVGNGKGDACGTDARRLSRALPPQPHSRSRVTVPQEAPTIQQAIDLVADGGTITVSPGIYDETLEIFNLSLALEGQGTVQLSSHERGSAITLFSETNKEIQLRGLQVGPSSGAGVITGGQTIVNFSDSYITGNFIGNRIDGLHVGGTAQLSFFDSTISANGQSGLVVQGLASVSLRNSQVSHNLNTGLVVTLNGKVELHSSTIMGNGVISGLGVNPECLLLGFAICNGIQLSYQAQLRISDSLIKDNADWGLTAFLGLCGYPINLFTGQVTFEGTNVIGGNNTTGNQNGMGNPGNHPFQNLPDGQVCLP
jgi:hypothetical protein